MAITVTRGDLVEASRRVLSDPLVRRVAWRVGEPDAAVREALGVLVPATLALVAGHADETGFSRGVHGMVTEPAFRAVSSQGLDAAVGAAFGEGSAVVGMAARFRGAVYGDHVPAVARAVARETGVHVVSATTLTLVAAVLAEWILREAIDERDLDAEGFARWLAGEAPSLATATPEWLLVAMAPVGRTVPRTPTEVRVGDTGPPLRWGIYAVFAAAIVCLVVLASLLDEAMRG